MTKNTNEILKGILTSLYKYSGLASCEALADKAMRYMRKADGLCLEGDEDVSLRILKGGTYKIKGYYLEDDDLTDIRGASALISLVQDEILPQKLKEALGFDPIVYNGGGNIFALIPDDDKYLDIGLELEREADRYLITAQSAYYLSKPVRLSDLLGPNYKSTSASVESGLKERKRIKISGNSFLQTDFLGKELLGKPLDAEYTGFSEGRYCECCCKRLAEYCRKGYRLCAGCLHKRHAGAVQKSRYFDDYSAWLQKEGGGTVIPQIKSPDSFSEIDRGGVAVIYADGNNMGGIVQNVDSIIKMMDFSEFVKRTTRSVVYESLMESGFNSFEIVALGGDDIFIIIPGKGSIDFAVKIVEKYKTKFESKFPGTHSTLSVGMCIMKRDTPIKVGLEVAELEMDEAKKLVKTNSNSGEECFKDGSISFRVFKTYEGATGERPSDSLTPYSLKAAKTLLEASRNLGKGQSAIRNLSEAFEKAECREEAELFYRYYSAKSGKASLPQLDGFKGENGYYVRTGGYKTGQTGFVWNDLLTFQKY